MRVALVGAGGMARTYRNVYASIPGVEWELAVDVNDSELEACRQLGCRRTSSRFEDALVDGIDLVDISTPNFLHEAQAVAALAAGKHVLLQKPMANTLASADAIVAAARRARGTLGMYMSSYTNPLVWEIKSLLQSGVMGKVQSIRARDSHRGGLGAQAGAWRGSREKTGGGSFIQLSIHGINLVQWWLGSRITHVQAMSGNQHCPGIGGDDVTVATARFDNGVFGTFDSGYASEGLTREFYCTGGWFRLFDYDRQLELTIDRAWSGELIRYETPGKLMRVTAPAHPLNDSGSRFNQQRMFIEALRAGQRPHMTGEDGRHDLAVVMAVYESAQSGATVPVV